MSVWEDFKAKYAPPKIEDVTVGFSGIDPAGYASTLTEGQLELIKALVLAYISKLTIKIDSGSLDPDEPPPEVQPVTLHPSEIPHELLDGLLGGDEDGHYHLTDVQLDKLKAMIQAFVPDGEEVYQGVTSHEQLNELMGGTLGQHYHFTGDEWGKLRKVLAVLFPDGATEPQFPSVPSTDTEPSEPEEPEDLLGGLPAADPPQWTQRVMPSYTGTTPYDMHTSNKMYCGETFPSSGTRICAPFRQLKSSTKKNMLFWMYTVDGVNWTEWFDSSSTNGDKIGDYLAQTLSNGNWRLYFLRSPNTKVYYRYLNSGNKSGYAELSNSEDLGSSLWCAACYSPDLGMALFFTTIGRSCYMLNSETKVASNRYSTVGINVNDGCAVWIPTVKAFCVSGSNGVSLSSSGTSWNAHTEATIPKNLKGLTWMSNLTEPCLYAWREEDRQFYKSANGITWQVAGVLPSKAEISTITSVAYNSDYKEFCAVGGTTTYTYFSADLKTWRRANVVAEGSGNISMGSVIWYNNVKKYILLPTTGTNFYTFDRPNWK